MSVDNKKDNLTTITISRSQAKNNPKLAEIIEDNREKAFEIKKKTSAENQESKNPNTLLKTSALRPEDYSSQKILIKILV